VTLVRRRARPSDLGCIDRIERASFGNPWPLDAYAQELDREEGLLEVAMVRGEGVVGFSCSWQVAKEMHLLRIATDPRFRRRGIGRDLFGAVLARARGSRCRQVTLEVASGNRAAIRMYEAAGLREIGRRHGYYRVPPDDALVMRLDLEVAVPGPTPELPPVAAVPRDAAVRWTDGGG
jgi:ribosomal-protein-alanine N-acetyltransferase